jgi:hypothetical protein
MTGFISGLFGSNGKKKDEQAQAAPKQAATEKESNAFFLDMTDARTLGNTEYMKASKTVRRTFPKTAGQPEEMELIQQVSAMDRIVEGKVESTMVSPIAPMTAQTEAPKSAPQPAAAEKTVEPPTTERRKADSSMDMFRSMARDIKK